MHERGEPDGCRQAYGEILAKRIRRGASDSKAQPAEEGKQGNYGNYPDETPLLTDSAEEEVGIGVRQIAELLLAFSETNAEQPTRSNPHERLVDLKAGVRDGISRVHERE